MTHSFGPFRLDPRNCRLTMDGQVIETAPKVLDLLVFLIRHAGALVTKDEILAACWPATEVTENALTQVISDLRRILGDSADEPIYIETVPRRGYRFIGPITTHEPIVAQARSSAPYPILLPGTRAGVRETSNAAAHDALLQGRRRLERMDLAEIPAAIEDFERAAALDPRYALPHVGLAHARFWLFEATRIRNCRDKALLTAAIADAHRATDLDPDLPEAYAALAWLLTAAGRGPEAVAAGRRAVALEPANWRNHCRLALAAWGSESVASWTHVLDLHPDFAFARCGVAMVAIAKGELDAAEAALRLGAATQDRVVSIDARFPTRGAHWLLGLVRLNRGDVHEAIAEFRRERQAGGDDVYATEFIVNALDGEGFSQLSTGAIDASSAAFSEALTLAPDHGRSLLGLAAVHVRAGRTSPRGEALARAHHAIGELRADGRSADAELLLASAHVIEGRRERALDTLERLLATAPAGSAGWTIPVEPLLAPAAESPEFAKVLFRLAHRAG